MFSVRQPWELGTLTLLAELLEVLGQHQHQWCQEFA